MELDKLRSRIDEVDAQIVSLLNQRAAIALRIGAAKKGQPIHQPAREAQVLHNIQTTNQGPLSAEELAVIYKKIVEVCRNLQSHRSGKKL